MLQRFKFAVVFVPTSPTEAFAASEIFTSFPDWLNFTVDEEEETHNLVHKEEGPNTQITLIRRFIISLSRGFFFTKLKNQHQLAASSRKSGARKNKSEYCLTCSSALANEDEKRFSLCTLSGWKEWGKGGASFTVWFFYFLLPICCTALTEEFGLSNRLVNYYYLLPPLIWSSLIQQKFPSRDWLAGTHRARTRAHTRTQKQSLTEASSSSTSQDTERRIFLAVHRKEFAQRLDVRSFRQ